MNKRSFYLLVCLCLLVLGNSALKAQTPGTDQIKGMQWRMIGPFRGGRTVGATGVPGQPNVLHRGK